jgi:hypothetical protein
LWDVDCICSAFHIFFKFFDLFNFDNTFGYDLWIRFLRYETRRD